MCNTEVRITSWRYSVTYRRQHPELPGLLGAVPEWIYSGSLIGGMASFWFWLITQQNSTTICTAVRISTDLIVLASVARQVSPRDCIREVRAEAHPLPVLSAG